MIHKQIGIKTRIYGFTTIFCFVTMVVYAQAHTKELPGGKRISPTLFGLFFEDINYAADGGLYAELVQNRSFEYNPTDRRDWHSLTSWQYITQVFSYGSIDVVTNNPVHFNNTHYVVLNVEHIGQHVVGKGSDIPENKGVPGIGLKNQGYDHMVVEKGKKYFFSMMGRLQSEIPINVLVQLQTNTGKIIGENRLTIASNDWQKYESALTAEEDNDSISLVILATTTGQLGIDVVSLFPENTFKNRKNGLRPDLAQLLADMTPAFIRFPGGCLAHGDGLGNMYRWKNTIGPIEERKEQKNLWGYHQTAGLGFYEYFQFCEDIGAKPLPVLPAAVSCQNSGGTWRIGGTGQQALPENEMDEYTQEVLDLIEWANGPVSSEWGAKRAAQGHPEPYRLEYVGIGNEDKITPEFEANFKMIFSAVKTKYPDIHIIGTSGPFSEGEDFEKGWQIANACAAPMVDEHYYKQPDWFISNLKRYDTYDRSKPGVYLGEYASWGNKHKNAIAEAAFMTTLERNGDIVKMASYAPLFAKKDHTQWKTDMVFFDNKTYYLTTNYHVQKMFSTNQGDVYFDQVFSKNPIDTLINYSCVKDSKSGDIILKMVNSGNTSRQIKVDLSKFKNLDGVADKSVLAGNPDDENSFENPEWIVPTFSKVTVGKAFDFELPPSSLSVLRIKIKSKK